MAGDRRKDIERHLDASELDAKLRDADDVHVLRRLVFVKNLYRGDTLTEAADRVGRSDATASRWADRWNEGGLEELAPDFGGGRPPKLDEDDRERLLEILESSGPLTRGEIGRLIQDEFGVTYHPTYLSAVLRSLGLEYVPPQRRSSVGRERATEALDGRDRDARTGPDAGRNEPAGRTDGVWTVTERTEEPNR